MTVIADEARPVGLAGIMGGFDAEVTDATTRIFLEVARFDPTITRATSRALKLRTEASARYERGVDQESLPIAVARAAQLIRELCPDAVFAGYYRQLPRQTRIYDRSHSRSRVSSSCSVWRLPRMKCWQSSSRLDFDASIEGDTLSVGVPSYRRDVSTRQDIIEEVARIAGYERLPATLPSGATQAVHRDPMYRMRIAARAALVGAGYNEAITYVTVDQTDIERFSDGAFSGVVVDSHTEWLIRLKNALQSDRNLMRPTLIPSMLPSLAENLRHTESVRLAELARVYVPTESTMPSEVELVGLVAAGKRDSLGLDQSKQAIDFFEMKGAIELVLDRLGARQTTTSAWSHPAFHPGRSAEIRIGDQVVARFGELHPTTAASYGIDDQRVLAGEINLTALMSAIAPRGRDAVVPRFLPVQQDFAVVVSNNILAADVEAAFRNAAGPLLTDITLFDTFSGPQVGEGKVSMAYRLTFTAPDRTLTDNDLVKIRPKIEKVLKQRVEGVLRA